MELIGKQIAIETILGQPPELHYPSWYAAQIEKLPPAPPEYLAEQAGILVTDADTISRAKAIEALHMHLMYRMGTDSNKKRLDEWINNLPSAQPVQCEDAVSRETILKFFDDWMSVLDENCHNQSVSDLKIIKRDFANLPPVTPKQRTGKWIRLDMHAHLADHKCTACEQECYVPTCMGEPIYAFCPNCGAKMEVTE